ncbi:MAG: hypothetical protein N2201_04745 [candidate division WOR-3 bacterium]|nr:hypothetical protein [candidate division WOR-3 bacterium]
MLILFYLLTIFEYQEIGGSSSALQISSTIQSTYNATAINPSLLSRLNKNGIGLVYCRPFEIRELQYNRLSLNYKNFGLGITRLGFISYQEYTLSFSAGFDFSSHLAYGIMVKGLYLDLSDYGQTIMPALNLGISYFVDKINFSAVLENFNYPQNSLGEKLPWQVLAGILFEPVSDFRFGGDLIKSPETQYLAIGTEFKLLPELTFCLGTKTNPLILSTGLSIIFKNIHFDYSFQYHTKLKQTSIFSLGYFW